MNYFVGNEESNNNEITGVFSVCNDYDSLVEFLMKCQKVI